MQCHARRARHEARDGVARHILKAPAPQVAALAGMVVLAAALGIGRFAYTPLLPPMQEGFGWTVAQAGDVASANLLGYVIGALAAAGLAQGPRRLRWLAPAFIASAATTLAGALVESLAVWFAVRFVAGIASALCFVISTAVIIEFVASRAQPQWTALHFAGVGIGIVLSVVAIEAARSAGASIPGQWGALGMAAAVLLAAAWPIVRSIPMPERLSAGRATSAPARPTRRLARLIAAYGLFGFGYVVTATFIVAIARRLENAAILEPMTWIVVGLLAAPSIIVWQRLARGLGIFAALRLAYALEAAGVLLAGFASGPIALVLGGALLGGTFVGITALGLLAARQIAVTNQNQVTGWMSASFGLGQLIGPAVAGRLTQATQSFAVPSVVAAALLVVGIALLWELERG